MVALFKQRPCYICQVFNFELEFLQYNSPLSFSFKCVTYISHNWSSIGKGCQGCSGNYIFGHIKPNINFSFDSNCEMDWIWWISYTYLRNHVISHITRSTLTFKNCDVIYEQCFFRCSWTHLSFSGAKITIMTVNPTRRTRQKRLHWKRLKSKIFGRWISGENWRHNNILVRLILLPHPVYASSFFSICCIV